jgi:hypothetical protein
MEKYEDHIKEIKEKGFKLYTGERFYEILYGFNDETYADEPVGCIVKEDYKFLILRCRKKKIIRIVRANSSGTLTCLALNRQYFYEDIIEYPFNFIEKMKLKKLLE